MSHQACTDCGCEAARTVEVAAVDLLDWGDVEWQDIKPPVNLTTPQNNYIPNLGDVHSTLDHKKD